MSNFKLGDKVQVITTEEPVIVIGTREMTADDRKNFPDYNEIHEVVTVRRPVMTADKGIQYSFYDFLPFELENEAEAVKRNYAKQKAYADIVQQEMISETTGPLEVPKSKIVRPS